MLRRHKRYSVRNPGNAPRCVTLIAQLRARCVSAVILSAPVAVTPFAQRQAPCAPYRGSGRCLKLTYDRITDPRRKTMGCSPSITYTAFASPCSVDMRRFMRSSLGPFLSFSSVFAGFFCFLFACFLPQHRRLPLSCYPTLLGIH